MSNEEDQPHQKAKGSYIAQADRGGVAKVITNIFQGGTEEARALRNRQTMLKKVHDFWVKGVLEQSLYGEIIRLGLMTAPQAVDHRPWDVILQTPEQPEQLLPADTKILDVFDDMGQTLLILGEPGSGKTTMLLELAHDTIARAKEDPTQPIPVVFNLSSWAQERKALDVWLIEELKTRYDIPAKVAKPWIENDDLLLLLDGLDEVTQSHQEACIQTINRFQEKHMVPAVVCSRTQDYQAINEKLKLSGAIALQELTIEQTEKYIKSMKFSDVMYKRWENDKELRELTSSPLILSIFALAFQDAPAETLHALAITNNYQEQLFNTYIQKVYVRRGGEQPYNLDETYRWLTWLAHNMKSQDQTTFFLEKMHPHQLLGRGKTFLIYRLVVGLVAGLLVVGMFWGAIGGLILGLGVIRPIETIKVSWKRLRGGVMIGLMIGLFSALCSGWGIGSFGQSDVGLFFEIVFIFVSALVAGSVLGLFFGTVLGLLFGLVGEEIPVKTKPNEGIRRSGLNGLIIGLVFGLIVGLAVGPRGGVVSGFLSGLFFGGFAVIQHYTLRFILWRQGNIPLKYVHFLDFAAERLYLRKVGGGYIFIHRMLLEHFADMYEEQFAQKT